MNVPSPSLALLADLIVSRRSPQSIPTKNWPILIDLAQRNSLASVLAYTLKQANLDFPSAQWQRLMETVRETTVQYRLLDIAQTQLDAHFLMYKIDPIWLKGIALAKSVYQHPTLRPMSDLDVLVPFREREVALSAAQELGYHFNPNEYKLFAPLDPVMLSIGHNFALLGGPLNGVMLELHYRLLSGGTTILPVEQMAWFLGQKKEINGIRTLSPEAHMLYLCAHAELQHGNQLYLLRYFDLHLLVTQNLIDWAVVVEQAIALHWTYVVGRAFEKAEKYFGTPLPAGFLNELRAQRPSDREIHVMMQFQRRHGSPLDRLHIYLPQLSLRNRLRLMIRLLMPPLNYMREIYAIAPGRSIWPYYLYRWVENTRKVMHKIGKLDK